MDIKQLHHLLWKQLRCGSARQFGKAAAFQLTAIAMLVVMEMQKSAYAGSAIDYLPASDDPEGLPHIEIIAVSARMLHDFQMKEQLDQLPFTQKQAEAPVDNDNSQNSIDPQIPDGDDANLNHSQQPEQEPSLDIPEDSLTEEVSHDSAATEEGSTEQGASAVAEQQNGSGSAPWPGDAGEGVDKSQGFNPPINSHGGITPIWGTFASAGAAGGLYAALNSGATNTNPVTAPQLKVEQSSQLAYDANNDGVIGRGDTVQFTLTIHNAGTAHATGIKLANILDSNVLANVTAITGNGVYDPNIRQVSWVVDEIAANQNAVVTFTATLNNTMTIGSNSLINLSTLSADNFAVSANSYKAPVDFYQGDVSSLNDKNGFNINGAVIGDNAAVAVSHLGDFNGDGYTDLLIGANNTQMNGEHSGSAYVLLGKENGYSEISLQDIALTSLLRMDGAQNSFTGSSVSAAGDVNGDGFSDYIVSASDAAYIVFGSNHIAAASEDLSVLLAQGGALKLTAANITQVSGGADINNDGFSDVIVGNTHALGDAGAYVLFGSNNFVNSNIDLATMSNADGFYIHDSTGALNSLGAQVTMLDDINGDGHADVLVSAPYTSDSKGYAAVVFGGEHLNTIDVSQLDGTNGFSMHGINANDQLGVCISNVGDINYDGFNDFAVSSDASHYVVFGGQQGYAADLDLSTLDGTNGFSITNISTQNSVNSEIASAGDFNGDGVNDMMFTSFDNATAAWALHVLYGKDEGFNASYQVSDLGNGSDGFVITGLQLNNNMVDTNFAIHTAGDINSDGFADIVLGSATANSNAGMAQVIFGFNANHAVTQLGTNANDILYGTNGDDVMNGMQGSDSLYGGPGDDVMKGAAGIDILQGDSGNNILVGGTGNDTFGIKPEQNAQVQKVLDFNQNFAYEQDKIDISAFKSILNKYDINHDGSWDDTEFANVAAGQDNNSHVANISMVGADTIITLNNGGVDEQDAVIHIVGHHVTANDFIV